MLKERQFIKNLLLNVALFLLAILFVIGCSNTLNPKEDKETPQPPTEYAGFNPNYIINFENPVQDKNFYMFSMMQRLLDVNKVLSNDSVFSNKLKKFQTLLNNKQNSCLGNVVCYSEIFNTSESERVFISNHLEKLTKESTVLQNFVTNHLRPCGFYQKYISVNDSRLVSLIYRDAVIGLNHIIDVYALGKSPIDSDSDSISFDTNGAELSNLVNEIVEGLVADSLKFQLFFEPTLKFAMELLRINKRDEAGRFEPLSEGENLVCSNLIPTVKWDKYKYSVLAVLGDSPNSPGDAINISNSAKSRCKIATEIYNAGKAPLIIISGSNVYPFQTPFYEAIEMKKYLMEQFNIPEQVILVDPHGRHTPTNLRNFSRIMYRYKIPSSKKGIIVATKSHIEYIASDKFRQRCLNELGYMPSELGNKLSINELEFLPVIKSLHINLRDPLDP